MLKSAIHFTFMFYIFSGFQHKKKENSMNQKYGSQVHGCEMEAQAVSVGEIIKRPMIKWILSLKVKIFQIAHFFHSESAQEP